MKIGPQDKPGMLDANTTASGANGAGRISPEARAALMRAGGLASALAAADRGTEVVLSDTASALASAQGVSTGQDVDLDKVRRMQAAIAQGQYRVNPGAIADQLIADAQAFMPTGKR